MLKLKFLALLGVVALVACTSNGDDEVQPDPDDRPFVAVYFFEGRALAPVYRRLPPGAPGTAVMSLLLGGPPPGLTTALPAETRASASEAPEGLLVELSGRYWQGSPRSMRRGAAQIVFSLAALEEGKQVTLLKGLVPGNVAGLEAPFERSDFDRLRPWIRVAQPVAGGIVANPFPVDVTTRGDIPYRITVLAADGSVAGEGRGDRVGWDTEADMGIVVIEVGGHSVEVPIRFKP